MTTGDTLLLVLPVPFRRDEAGRLMFETQACNGLDRWADNFSRVIVACPLLPTTWHASNESTSAGYTTVDQIAAFYRIEFVPLPAAYSIGTFARKLGVTKRLLAQKIADADYLSFAIGGLVGDWGAVAAMVAKAHKRPYSIWTDRVEHRVVKAAYADARGARRIVRWLKNGAVVSPLMKLLEHHVIRHSALGLFHGRDCFQSYSPYCRAPHIVHDIHLKASDRIGREELTVKLLRSTSAAPLNIVYAGRAAEMKGPMDWIQVLAKLHGRGLAFQAVWMGDGPLLERMRAEVARLGLAGVVSLPGNVKDRDTVLASLRGADLFLFCHQTPESPRCLIEALMAGTPIAGYDMPYPRDLLGEVANEWLVRTGDLEALAALIADLAIDRPRLSRLVQTAANIGSHFSDDAVFRHRSSLIRRFLPAALALPSPQSHRPG